MQIKRIRYSDIEEIRPIFKESIKLKESFSGTTPTPFVGRYGYPKVNLGILSTPFIEKEAESYDSPSMWADKGYDISHVLAKRLTLINSFDNIDIKKGKGEKIFLLAQETAMASRPSDIEVRLDRKPKTLNLNDSIITPMGPSARLKKIRVTSNVKIPNAVEKAYSDTDLKAGNALSDLYHRGFDENYLTRLLSTASLGVKKNRKLVPTRWSITAVDDTVGKSLYHNIRYNPDADYNIKFGSYLGNNFFIAIMPGPYSFELFELYLPTSKRDSLNYTHDYELYKPRTRYAENCAGGYYAARLPILSYLKSIHRNASVLVIRVIDDSYYAPLGVWVVRESVKKAVRDKGVETDSDNNTKKILTDTILKRFNLDITSILDGSVLLRERRSQKRIFDF